MKQQEISKASVEELKTQTANLTEQLEKMKLTHAVSPLENPLTIRHTRRTIARLKTELTKREAQA
ncbi:MAG: 50S ribosomal protein L29 [Flavobacteriales bacterium]|nr:50S ribosomal protein L29 [Flavobacteriales bacterium]PIE86803.1 MAG: 50S ribosomal protein L29 [Bacteroidota bacterium]